MNIVLVKQGMVELRDSNGNLIRTISCYGNAVSADLSADGSKILITTDRGVVELRDSNGNLIQDYTPEIESRLSISGSIWDVIHTGMRSVIENKSEYADMGVAVAGKTGTAQESKSRPSHALFICYAPADSPEIAMAVRIGHGYSSTNAIMTAKDILNYYFDLVDKSDIITGLATTENLTSTSVD